MKAFLRNKKAVTGLGILVFFALMAIFAGVIDPHNPNNINFTPLAHPSSAHLSAPPPRVKISFPSSFIRRAPL